MNALPMMIDSARQLRKNDAKYHQKCRLMCNNSNNSMLKRVQKRASSATEDTNQRGITELKKNPKEKSCSILMFLV